MKIMILFSFEIVENIPKTLQYRLKKHAALFVANEFYKKRKERKNSKHETFLDSTNLARSKSQADAEYYAAKMSALSNKVSSLARTC